VVTNKSKQKCITLRSRGFSYGEISIKTGISKNTIKYWCKNIVLRPEYKKRLYTKQIDLLSKGPKSSHARRQKEIELINNKAEEKIKSPLSMDAYRLFGAALYWAEGNKISDFTITNSDPLLIQFMTKWLCDMFKLTPENLTAHLNIYPQQDDLKIKRFWSEITKIPLSNFGKSFIKPSNKNYKKNTLYYGTIKIRVHKGTNFRIEVFSWINKVLKNNKIDVEITERKWYKLKDNYKRQ